MNSEKKIKIAFGCDHAGFDAKEEIFDYLVNFPNIQIKDFGTDSNESVDYPDFVHPVAKMVNEGNADWGILCCGSGNGVAMTANKYANVRAALCWNDELARLAKKHNDANIICLPIRFISKGEPSSIIEAFKDSAFEGGRHERRVNKISNC